MQIYCLVCGKTTNNANSKVIKVKERLQMKSLYTIRGNRIYWDLFHKDLVYFICWV